MKIRTFILSLPITLCFLLHAQRSPQDSWYLDRQIPLSGIPGLNSPHGIDFSENGDLYVVDHGNDRITRWSSNGDFINGWGRNGTGDGQLNNPRDLVIGGGKIYVADQSNHRIQVFDMDGNFLFKWGSNGGEDGKFRNPHGITLTMNGNEVNEVFVSEWDNHRVQVFDANGTHLRNIGIGSYGGSDNQFGYASGVYVDGNLLFASSRNYNKIKVFDINGTYLRSMNTSGHPYHIDGYGNRIAVTMGDHHKVQVFDKNGTLLHTIGTSASYEDGKFYHNFGLAYNPGGTLHVSGRQSHRVQSFDHNGSYLNTIGSYGTRNVDPYDFAITEEGTYLVADIDGDRVLEFDENGTAGRTISAKGNLDGEVNDPRAVAIHQNKIYIADGSNHRVQVFDRNGTFLFKFGSSGTGNGQFNQPYGLLISPSTNEVYVADRYNHRIQVFDMNGNYVRKFGSQGNLEGQFNQPVGLDFNDDGSLCILSHANNRLINVSTSGQYLSHWNTNGGSMHVANLNNGLTGITWGSYIGAYEENGFRVKYWNKNGGTYSSIKGLRDGSILLLNRNRDEFAFYKQTFRTIRPPISKEIPLPEVISVNQVEGSNYLEITYRINDADSSHVEAALLGFVDGGSDFSKIVVPKTFIGSVQGKLDNNVTTNQIHTVTWNAEADWSVGFGEIEMAVLAKDDRDLLNLHFLSLPMSDSNSTELVINRSPLTDNDLLPLWYWQVAKGNENLILDASDNSIKVPFEMETHDPQFLPSSIDSLVFWVDANDSATITQSNGVISKWADKSGNERNATLGGGSPEFAVGDGPNGLPFIKFRRASGEDFLNVGGTGMIARHMFYICRSPTERWNYYGGILGHQNGRGSNYLFEINNFTYHSNRYPQAVYKNGTDLMQNTGFNMSPLTNFMILEVVVDNSSLNLRTNYKIGRNDGYSLDFDVVEILAFNDVLNNERIPVLQYLSHKTNIALGGRVLARNTATTTQGRTFLLDLMDLREATSDEVTLAKEGSVQGTTNKFTPTFKVGPDERPNRVNEYGFDTANSSGFWVVPK